MAKSVKKIAVVGGGFAGMCSVTCLKEEGGFEPVCFEKTSNPGGTWYYREEVEIGVPSIMPTTIINHSKEMGALSTYPPPKENNNFMRHSELYDYAINYFKSNDVLKHVQCNMEVISVKKAPDYEETGRWVVTVKNTESSEETTDTYDGVMVCVGHVNRPNMPSYPGQDLFKGKILHTHSLKGVESYRDKTVVVVGMGCSGLDAAVETSNVAKQVYVSTRSGAHVFQRVGPHGYPYDYTLARRYIFSLFDIFPASFISWLLECLFMDPQFNQRLYTVQPKHHLLSKDPVINDHLASKLLSGLVKQERDIERFTEDGVIFEGDDEVTKADAVIMATGYTWKFPFLEDDVIVKEEGRINLYKCMFPTQLEHGTLVLIGFILPYGPGFPLGELQCRWATQVLAGNCKLPSKEEMLKDVIDRQAYNVKRYLPSEKMSLRVDFLPYCDDIASEFGAKPNFVKMFFTDPKLFFKLVFGPTLSYQYRLQGPHAWDGAREAIMTSEDRVLYPLNKGNLKETHENMLVTFIKKILRMIFF
ncbi:dimethylaniline monooxygenase [N-oxide-forming] 2-like [Argiope bruennichi]|uniref:dimethylaniline monooxygenase [N-oxide-forming] 2-like n=1 Tax=Argiope bruennichi TaxID=94029 RepID=UPI002493EB1A|nr:dimethylaniline monooxygenase [N-oxide-forming] 2-like [Argiope bruennichi]